MSEVLNLAQKRNPVADVDAPSVRPAAPAHDTGAAAPETVPEDRLDRLLHAREAPLTSSLSYISLLLAYLDWSLHLANSPAQDAAHKWMQLFTPSKGPFGRLIAASAMTAGTSCSLRKRPCLARNGGAATAATIAKQHSDRGLRSPSGARSPSNSPPTNPRSSTRPQGNWVEFFHPWRPQFARGFSQARRAQAA